MLDASQLGAQGSDGGCAFSVSGPARDSAKTLCELQRNTKKKHTPNIFWFLRFPAKGKSLFRALDLSRFR